MTELSKVTSGGGYVQVEGGRVWYDRVSGGPQAPLLCIQGGPGFPHEPLRSLAEVGERDVIFYDQLGCGRSDRCSDDSLLNLPRFVNEVEELREHLSIDEVHVYGTSWGATIAAAYAAQNPLGLRSLILSSPLISTRLWMEDALRLRGELPLETQAVLDSYEEEGFTESPAYAQAMDQFYKKHLCRLHPWPEVLVRSIAEASFDIYNKMWGPSEFEATGTLLSLDLTDRLSQISVPTLFTAGEFDESTPKTVEGLARLVPQGRFEVIPGTSHTPYLEDPQALLRILRTFIVETEA